MPARVSQERAFRIGGGITGFRPGLVSYFVQETRCFSLDQNEPEGRITGKYGQRITATI